jgi:general stress protein CsbA
MVFVIVLMILMSRIVMKKNVNKIVVLIVVEQSDVQKEKILKGII